MAAPLLVATMVKVLSPTLSANAPELLPLLTVVPLMVRVAVLSASVGLKVMLVVS